MSPADDQRPSHSAKDDVANPARRIAANIAKLPDLVGQIENSPRSGPVTEKGPNTTRSI
jgi:hypothetical protein